MDCDVQQRTFISCLCPWVIVQQKKKKKKKKQEFPPSSWRFHSNSKTGLVQAKADRAIRKQIFFRSHLRQEQHNVFPRWKTAAAAAKHHNFISTWKMKCQPKVSAPFVFRSATCHLLTAVQPSLFAVPLLNGNIPDTYFFFPFLQILKVCTVLLLLQCLTLNHCKCRPRQVRSQP